MQDSKLVDRSEDSECSQTWHEESGSGMIMTKLGRKLVTLFQEQETDKHEVEQIT